MRHIEPLQIQYRGKKRLRGVMSAPFILPFIPLWFVWKFFETIAKGIKAMVDH